MNEGWKKEKEREVLERESACKKNKKKKTRGEKRP